MSKDNMMVFGYARVSTDNQLENYSIEEQTARLEAYCLAKGWTLLRTYIDGGYSGGNTDRPALQQMLTAIRENNIDAVVVYKLDRLSRSQKDTLTLIEDEFLANGTDFVSINENFDTSTPFGRAMIGILSVFAQLEKDQITERFTMGRIGRSKAGYFHGGPTPPTGYDYVDGLLIVNEYEAMQVREAFDLFLSGKTLNWIYHYLDKRYTTKWSPQKVLTVIRNSVYIGKVKFRGQEYDGLQEPIVSKDTYEAANRLLNSSSREEGKNTAQKNPYRAGYLLSGLIFCGRCGAKYAANHGYYKCYSRSKGNMKYVKDPNCKNENLDIQRFDDYIISQIDEIVCSEKKLKAAIASAESGKKIVVDKRAIRKRIADIDGQIQKLIDLYQLGSIPMETITKRVNELSEERKALQEKLNVPDEVPAADLFLSALDDYKDGFAFADIDKRRLMVSSLIERIVIDGKSVHICWRL